MDMDRKRLIRGVYFGALIILLIVLAGCSPVRQTTENPTTELRPNEQILIPSEPVSEPRGKNADIATSNPGGIVILRHPFDETYIEKGHNVIFEAQAENYDWVSWEFRIGLDGEPFSAEQAVFDYGIIIEGFNRERILIYGVDWEMDGWQIRAVFHKNNGEVAFTDWAKIGLFNPV